MAASKWGVMGWEAPGPHESYGGTAPVDAEFLRLLSDSQIRVTSSGSPQGQSVHRHGSPPCICSPRSTEPSGQGKWGWIQSTKEALCGEGIKALLEGFCRKVASGGENSLEPGVGPDC